MAGRAFADGPGKGELHPVGRLLEFEVRRHPCESKEGLHGHAVAGGDRPVVDRFLPDGSIPVVGGEEEPPAFAVPVAGDEVPGEFGGGPEIAGGKRRLVDLDESPEHEGVIVEGRGKTGLAVPVAMEEPPVRPPEVLEDECRRLLRRRQVRRVVEGPGGFGKSRDHQGVPVGQDLVVLCRADPLLAGCKEPLPGAFHEPGEVLLRHRELVSPGCQRPAHAEDVLARPPRARLLPVVPRLRDVKDPREPFAVVFPEDPDDLVFRPEVELPLLALAVRIFRRVEPAGRIGHVPQDVGDRLPCGPGKLLPSRRKILLRICHHQERLVVEHLLEVRDEPLGVRRIAVEPVADLVEDPAPPHGVQRLLDHRVGRLLPGPVPVTEQEYEVVRSREFGCVPKPAVLTVEDPEEGLVGLIENGLVKIALPRRGAGRALERLHHLTAGVLEVLTLALPDLADPGDEVEEPGHPVTALFWYVTRCKERFFVGSHQDGERPPPRSRQRVGGRHVDLVDIRPLLAVHLDADKDVV
ncbi:hypothetical protein DSECCO2_593300 [anaerobic digester metagenome]